MHIAIVNTCYPGLVVLSECSVPWSVVNSLWPLLCHVFVLGHLSNSTSKLMVKVVVIIALMLWAEQENYCRIEVCRSSISGHFPGLLFVDNAILSGIAGYLSFLMCCDGLVLGSFLCKAVDLLRLAVPVLSSSISWSSSCFHRVRNNLLQIWYAAMFREPRKKEYILHSHQEQSAQ